MAPYLKNFLKVNLFSILSLTVYDAFRKKGNVFGM